MPEHDLFGTPDRLIVVPNAYYLTGDDNLRVSSLNSLTGVTIRIDGRYYIPGRGIQAFRFTHTPNTDRTAGTTNWPTPPGWLLNVTAIVTAGTPQLGQTFVSLQLLRGLTGDAYVIGTLTQGYVTGFQMLAWPGSPIQNTLDTEGVIRHIGGTNPAAGSEISETVPTGARWALQAFFARFTASSAGANREPELIADDGSDLSLQVPAGVSITASQARGLSWYPAAERYTLVNSDVITMPFPPVLLTGGHRLRTNTRNLQSGDDWGAPQFVVREWLSGLS